MSTPAENPAGSRSVPESAPVSRLGSRLGFRRSVRDRWIAGVCGGIAERTGLDVNLVRVVAVLLAVFGHLIGLIAYLAAWALVPEESAEAPRSRPSDPTGAGTA